VSPFSTDAVGNGKCIVPALEIRVVANLRLLVSPRKFGRGCNVLPALDQENSFGTCQFGKPHDKGPNVVFLWDECRVRRHISFKRILETSSSSVSSLASETSQEETSIFLGRPRGGK
jgi:hypothetical protein